MRFSTKAITTCAVLAALALALSYLESFFPPLLPLPGVKLGLANIVTVYALYALGASSALAILVVRCLLGSLFAGQQRTTADRSPPRCSRLARPRRSLTCRFCCSCRCSPAR